MEENITIEFVKEWIDKHNLTKGSFDRIMNDLIYNSGHNYIDNPSLRYWLIDNTYKFRDMLPVELNKHQQVVLEWLKVQGKRRPIMTIADFADAYYGLEGAPTVPLEILSSYEQLSDSETYQVLAAFAEWGGRKYE
ncbi:MAG: hypothetical protein ACLR1F_19945 [Enterococcus avium]